MLLIHDEFRHHVSTDNTGSSKTDSSTFSPEQPDSDLAMEGNESVEMWLFYATELSKER